MPLILAVLLWLSTGEKHTGFWEGRREIECAICCVRAREARALPYLLRCTVSLSGALSHIFTTIQERLHSQLWCWHWHRVNSWPPRQGDYGWLSSRMRLCLHASLRLSSGSWHDCWGSLDASGTTVQWMYSFVRCVWILDHTDDV